MDILKKITENTRREVALRKEQVSLKTLESSVFFTRKMPSFRDALNMSGPSIIGEFKRKSPSSGIISSREVEFVAKGYEQAGVSAISVLTDQTFFGGFDSDLLKAAAVTMLPLLRKDFIIDEYQVVEAKSIGASAILLIASVLDKDEIKNLAELAFSLGLDVLFEIHMEEELEKMNDRIRIIGVNNRNLNTFETDISQSAGLCSRLPGNCIRVAESGIKSPEDVLNLYNEGYDAFLIGETFMRSEDPGKTAKQFIEKISVSS